MKKIFALMLFPLIASGGVMKTIDLKFTKLGKTLSILTENGVCEASGPRAYQIAGTASGFSLVCRIRGEMSYDSDIPVDVIENFTFPESVAEDMDKFKMGYGRMASQIKKTKKPWGIEYEWSTPTSGSMTSHYLCPKNTKLCIRVKVGGLERLTFNFK